MSNISGSTSVGSASTQVGSRFARYSWTLFLLLSAILVLFGAGDLPGATTSIARENAINELFLGGFSAAIALMGLRRGQRWAWYAMALWPLWIGAQAIRAGSTGKTAEMMSAAVFMVLSLAGLALAYRTTAPARRQE